MECELCVRNLEPAVAAPAPAPDSPSQGPPRIIPLPLIQTKGTAEPWAQLSHSLSTTVCDQSTRGDDAKYVEQASNSFTKKRKAVHQSDGTTGALRPSRASSKRSKSTAGDEKSFNCPFYIFNPKTHQNCFKLHLAGIPRLVQHLERNHRQPPISCDKCNMIFPNVEARESHMLAPKTCHIGKFPVPRWVSDSQKEQILQLGRRGILPKDRWFAMWKILFPNQALPDPATIDMDSTLLMSYYQENYYREKGSRLVVERLGQVVVDLFADPASLKLVVEGAMMDTGKNFRAEYIGSAEADAKACVTSQLGAGSQLAAAWSGPSQGYGEGTVTSWGDTQISGAGFDSYGAFSESGGGNSASQRTSELKNVGEWTHDPGNNTNVGQSNVAFYPPFLPGDRDGSREDGHYWALGGAERCKADTEGPGVSRTSTPHRDVLAANDSPSMLALYLQDTDSVSDRLILATYQ